MAKSLGGGFPIGAFWVRGAVSGFAGAGHTRLDVWRHAARLRRRLEDFEVIERERLDENARQLGGWLKSELERLAKNYPGVVKGARGLGFMLGLELAENIPAFAASDKTPAIQFVNRLHAAGVLTIPAGARIVRLLPPLNLKPQEAGEGIAIIEETVKALL